MRHFEKGNGHLTDLEWLFGLDRRDGQGAGFQSLPYARGGEDRDAAVPRQRQGAAGVVRMAVREQDRVDVRHCFADAGQEPFEPLA